MVVANTRDQAAQRLANVGRIKTPSQAYLDDSRLDLAARKVQEPHGGGDLEKSDRTQVVTLPPLQQHHGFVNLVESGAELFGSNRLVVDADALLDGTQMRGSEQSGPIAGVAENGRQHGRGG